MKRTSLAIVVVLLSALTLAACSSANHASSKHATAHRSTTTTDKTHTAPAPTGAAGECPADYVAQVCGKVDVTGAQTVAFTATTTAPTGPDPDPSEKCVDLAKGVEGDMPLDVDLTGTGGVDVQSSLHISGYHGPGTYQLDGTHQTDDIQFQLTVTDSGGGDGGYIEVNDGSTVTGSETVTVGADFSVQVSFTGLPSIGDTAKTVTGSISWMCVDPKN